MSSTCNDDILKNFDNLKIKYQLEQDVNKELSKRIESLNGELLKENEKVKLLHNSYNSLDEKFNKFINLQELLLNKEFDNESFKSDLNTNLSEAKDNSIILLKEVQEIINPPILNPPITNTKQRRTSTFFTLPDISGSSLIKKPFDLLKSDSEDKEESKINEINLEEKLIDTTLLDVNNNINNNNNNNTNEFNKIKSLEINTDEKKVKIDKLILKNSLFEHFIVVGAPVEAAKECATKLSIIEQNSISNRFKKFFRTDNKDVKDKDNNSSPMIPKNSNFNSMNILDNISSPLKKNGDIITNSKSTMLSMFNNSPKSEFSNGKKDSFSFRDSFSSKDKDKDKDFLINSISNDKDIMENTNPQPISSTEKSFDGDIPKIIKTITDKPLFSGGEKGAAIQSIERFSNNMFSKFREKIENTKTDNSPIKTEEKKSDLTIKTDSNDNLSINTSNSSPISPSDVIKSSPGSSTKDIPLSLIEKSNYIESIPDNHNEPINSKISLLYRYPSNIEPPSEEVCDFCLPLGGNLRKLSDQKDEDTFVQEILYGHGQSKRSGRCFIFVLEDKTETIDSNSEKNDKDDSVEKENENDRLGHDSDRLYGICVIHQRLIRTTSEDDNNTNESMPNDINYDFDSQVCYCFLTRFPLFEFFFQAIFDVITAERLERMEKIALQDSPNVNIGIDRRVYEYLPSLLLEKILSRLLLVKPPLYGDNIHFQTNIVMTPNNKIRDYPLLNIAEHQSNASNWALPTLLLWLPPEILVWLLGLCLCECKIIVVGIEPGIVSCGVMGLLSLLQPLVWAAPVIPVLPVKHIDFVESPVPIICGLCVDAKSHQTVAANLLGRCE
jgi:hypothetical protein